MSWRLETEAGRQTWVYDANTHAEPIPFDASNQNSGDKIYRRQALVDYKPLPSLVANSDVITRFERDSLPRNAAAAAASGINFYSFLQMEDGHWPGDYGGPLFLLPGALITLHVTGVSLSPAHSSSMIDYLLHHQRDDGGWGIHIEAESTMFGTVLNYVALRLLGLSPTHPRLRLPRQFIKQHGGAMFAPSWAKFWLCVLNVMSWDGYNSVFPELWLFPDSLPLHPWRWWCHCRMVYLPMAYVYAHKITAPITPLIEQLRSELYTEPYERIQWHAHRNSIAAVDLYTPQTLYTRALNWVANAYERFHSTAIRKRASDFIISYIHAEDDQTKSIDIGPVNKFINMLSVWHADGPDSQRFRAHRERVTDYLWVAEDGMKCQGYNGSQLWDTAFSTQAICESGLAELFPETVERAYKYIEMSQVRINVDERETFYRHLSKGGWPFSTLDHGWPITDCTSEGLKATLSVHDVEKSGARLRLPERITEERLQDAVDSLLTFQNDDGGFATYENKRAGGWMELINPAEVFSGIMVDYSYCECTSASIQSLAKFMRHYPHYRAADIKRAVAFSVTYLKKIQREDGSWYGSWAVCFTYGGWFGIEGLRAGGETSQSSSVRRACAFLRSIQKSDGGWGESYQSCVKKVYVEHEHSQVINTAWAVLALMAGGSDDDMEAVRRGIRLIIDRQEDNGDWPQEGISGVFNGNCYSEDTRLMTEQGNLFLDEILEKTAGGSDLSRLRFACYNPVTDCIEYHPASALHIKPRGQHRMVDFTSASSQSRWRANSADKIGRVTIYDAHSNNVSLLVTADHDMFVQRGNVSFPSEQVSSWEQTTNENAIKPPAKYSASSLLSGVDGFDAFRLLGTATNGIHRDASALARSTVARLVGLSNDAQWVAFLKLYGFWISDGSLEYKESGAEAAINFTQRNESNREWLRQQCLVCGLVEWIDFTLKPRAAMDSDCLRITKPLWVTFFDNLYDTRCERLEQSPAPYTIEYECFISTEESSHSKWFADWVMNGLSMQETRFVLDGFKRTNGSWKATKMVYTSSITLRDQLLTLYVHAGYSPHFSLMYEKGDVCGWTSKKDIAEDGLSNANRKHPKILSATSYETLSENERGEYNILRATQDVWAVTYRSDDKELILRHDIDEVKAVDHYIGRVWCVTVPTGLVIAHRAFTNSSGVVTQISRPVVSANCMITYTNYRNIFPIWALGRYAQYCARKNENVRQS